MEDQKLVLVQTLCIYYELEASFFESLEEDRVAHFGSGK
jgi:hypothetical protein